MPRQRKRINNKVTWIAETHINNKKHYITPCVSEEDALEVESYFRHMVTELMLCDEQITAFIAQIRAERTAA